MLIQNYVDFLEFEKTFLTNISKFEKGTNSNRFELKNKVFTI